MAGTPSGFQQMGYFGVAVYASIISGFLKIIDKLGNQVNNHPFVFAVCSPAIIWMINSSDLPSIFLTHGLIVSVVIVWVSMNQIQQLSKSMPPNVN